MSSTSTLLRQAHPLSKVEQQLEWLSGKAFMSLSLPTFKEKLQEHGAFPLRSNNLEIFQMNLGYMCNQTCKHCHVDAGPDRKEIMPLDVMQSCLEVLRNYSIQTLDLTGGAPEMNPHFKWFIEEARPLVKEIIVRSNLTILRANAHYKQLPEFFAKNKLRVISSLPFYEPGKTDRQRGFGVFEKSIAALSVLNELGYGKQDSELLLDLVYNPTGAYLPAAQVTLEKEFKSALKQEYDIEFNSLFCITNLPISRYLDYLINTDNFEEYMDKLIEAFNPKALDGVMCKNTLSIDWNGQLFDCDFNQMLKLPVASNVPQFIQDFDINKLNNRIITINQHCYGCTAGSGSSCQGTLV
jgi:radical SAM/Cys-rich protein